MLLDDNISTAILEHIRKALTAAVSSAYQCFGDPELDRRGACLAPSNFDLAASHRVTFVGYKIDSCTMRVIAAIASYAQGLATTTDDSHTDADCQIFGFRSTRRLFVSIGNFYFYLALVDSQWSIKICRSKGHTAENGGPNDVSRFQVQCSSLYV